MKNGMIRIGMFEAYLERMLDRDTGGTSVILPGRCRKQRQ